jgi:large subunit ribosomal protein L36e
MTETNNRSGLYIGLNAGHVVNRPAKQAWKTRPVTKKGKTSKRVQLVRSIVREVAGFSPFEKKMLEMLRTGLANVEKKSVKQARAKFGTHRRAVAKRNELQDYINAQRRKE